MTRTAEGIGEEERVGERLMKMARQRVVAQPHQVPSLRTSILHRHPPLNVLSRCLILGTYKHPRAVPDLRISFLHRFNVWLSGFKLHFLITKTIALFATSGSSSMTNSINEAHALCPNACYVETLLLTSGTLSQMNSRVDRWLIIFQTSIFQFFLQLFFLLFELVFLH